MEYSYDKARPRWVDPSTVRWHDHPLSEKHVHAYEQDPNRTSTDGDPFIVIDTDGVARGWNGAHRAEAARRQGRLIKARVHDERSSGPAVYEKGCVLMLVALLFVPVLITIAVLV